MGAESRLFSVFMAGAVAALGVEGSAMAFCRTSSCPGVGTSQVCTPAESSDCGIPLFWPTPCVSFSMQEDGSKQVSVDLAESIVEGAFDKWTGALCPGGGKPHIKVINLGRVECAKHEYNQKEGIGNANIIMFRDDEWPHPGAGSTLALTTVTYNKETGEIYDADMEINSATTQLTTGDTDVKFDLPSIIQHETGHFLGLAHSTVMNPTPVMTPEYSMGDMDLRDLSEDDVLAICAVYPPGAAISDACDATPRHGFTSLCAADVKVDSTDGCCAIAPGASADHGDREGEGGAPLGRGGRAIGLVAVAALALAVRRRGGWKKPRAA